MCNHQPFISSMIPKDHKTWFSEPGRLDLFQDLNNPPHGIALDISNGAWVRDELSVRHKNF